MNDRELANKLVILGFAEGPNNYCAYAMTEESPRNWMQAHDFVRSWLVAGTMMQKCARLKRTIALSFGCEMFCATDADSATPTYGVYLERSNKSAARAIIEAAAAVEFLKV